LVRALQVTHDHTFSEIETWVKRRGCLAVITDRIYEADHKLQFEVNRHLDFYTLAIVQQGRGVHWIDERPYGIVRGDVYWMGPGSVHAYEGCKELVVEMFFFTSDIFDESVWHNLNGITGFPTSMFNSTQVAADDGCILYRISMHQFPGKWAN
jgi:mannose-6-phosphate isomerase-like protein (cupin superfamily)